MKSHNEILTDNIETILNYLGLEYTESFNKYTMPCPIHGGDNKNGCVVYKNGRFQCFTHGCHDSGSTLVTFIQKVTNKTYKETLDFIEQKFGKCVSYKSNNFNKNTLCLNKRVKKLSHEIPINTLKQRYNGSSEYYIKRGFKKETLEEFMVGIYEDRNRVSIPVFNKDFTSCLGYSSRSIFKKCCLCDNYHDYNSICVESPKWKHSYKLNRGCILYNQWNLKLFKTNTVFLVEGPPDVWKMWEAGIPNTLGLFGTCLTEDQKLILESCNITRIISFLDPDEAGKAGVEKIEKYCKNLYTYRNIDYKYEPSDCKVEELKEICGQYC